MEGDRAILTDLGSKNGTFVGDEPVSSPRLLHDGEAVRLGLRTYVVFQWSAADDTETEAR